MGSEVCDDGNTDDSSNCLADCSGVVDGYACSGGDNTTSSTCEEVCGDGVLTPSEDCDDNDLTDDDGCSSSCLVEDGWNCTDTLGSTSTCTEICGDGLVVGSET